MTETTRMETPVVDLRGLTRPRPTPRLHAASDIPDALWEQLTGHVPFREWKFCSDRRWRFDYAFLATNVAIEIEGGMWIRGRHVRPLGYEKDMEKYNRAAELGWLVLRYPVGRIDWDQVKRCLNSRASAQVTPT